MRALILTHQDEQLKVLHVEMIEIDKQESERMEFFKKQLIDARTAYTKKMDVYFEKISSRLKELNVLDEYNKDTHYLNLEKSTGLITLHAKDEVEKDCLQKAMSVLKGLFS